jgi:signal transduction histidine kinase
VLFRSLDTRLPLLMPFTSKSIGAHVRAAYSRSYFTGLKRHLQEAPAANLEAADKLGLRAVTIGFETLDLAGIHQAALEALLPPGLSAAAKKRTTRLAADFFGAAIAAIEETHQAAIDASGHIKIIIDALTRRTHEMVASNRKLNVEIARRKAGEATLRTSQTTLSQLLCKSRQMQDELRRLSRCLITAQEDERKRISRELHDVVAQTLTGINLRLAVLRSQITSNAKDLHKKIAITERLVEKSVKIVHQFARDLRPSVLDDLGLIPALNTYLRAYSERTGVAVHLTAAPGIESLNSTKKTALFRIAQEALVNTARHAKATRITVRIANSPVSVLMEIEDNGGGFDTGKVFQSKKRQGLGLLGIRERADMLGGHFTVESAPGQKTTVRIEIPTGKASRKKAAPSPPSP